MTERESVLEFCVYVFYWACYDLYK